jgi:hypothetical protein
MKIVTRASIDWVQTRMPGRRGSRARDMLESGLDLSGIATFVHKQQVRRARQALEGGQLHVADKVHKASRRCFTAATSWRD